MVERAEDEQVADRLDYRISDTYGNVAGALQISTGIPLTLLILNSHFTTARLLSRLGG